MLSFGSKGRTKLNHRSSERVVVGRCRAPLSVEVVREKRRDAGSVGCDDGEAGERADGQAEGAAGDADDESQNGDDGDDDEGVLAEANRHLGPPARLVATEGAPFDVSRYRFLTTATRECLTLVVVRHVWVVGVRRLEW